MSLNWEAPWCTGGEEEGEMEEAMGVEMEAGVDVAGVEMEVGVDVAEGEMAEVESEATDITTTVFASCWIQAQHVFVMFKA